MNWFTGLIDSFSGIVRLQPRESATSVPDRGNSSAEVVTETTVLSLPSALACIQLLSGTQATLPLMVYRPEGTGRVVAADHWLYRIIHDDPNADQTAVDFWEYMFVALELRGNAFAEKLRGASGQIIGLDPIPPGIVSVSRRSDGEIEYRWTWNGRSRKETAANVLHIRGFGGDPLGGMSTLRLGAEAFGLGRSLFRTAASVNRNAIRPSGLYQSDLKMSPEQIAQTRQLLEQEYQGAHRAGRPMVLGFGLKWAALTMSPEDLQMLESRAFSVEEICQIFGVPPHLIGHTAGNSQLGSSITEQTRAFEKFTLRRRLRRIEQSIRKQMLTAEDIARGITVEFNMEGLLRGSPAERASFYASGLDKGWLNVNQVCAWENLPPVEGGDVNRVQAQNVPLTMTAGSVAINATIPSPPAE